MIGQGQRRSPVTPKISFVSTTDWQKGRVSRNDLDRTDQDALRVTENVQLDQNGTVTPRPGTKLYGTQPTGTVIGQIFEYTRTNAGKTETWNIWFENRSGVGTVVTSKDGGSQTAVTGATYSVTSVKPHFEQVYGQVLIMNDVDPLSTMDVQTQVITVRTALSAVGSLSATPTGLTAGSTTLRYRYSAANQGETVASTAALVSNVIPREKWDGTTKYVTLSGSVPTNATRVNIYCGDTAGNEWFLDSVSVTGLTTFSYVDTGSIALNTNRVAPISDSTAGQKVTRATNIKGQIFLVGDADNPGRIWFGGYGNNVLDFSSYNGGGWVEPNKGGKDIPVRIIPFRDGKGTPMAACLSKGTNGNGKRYLLSAATTSIGTTSISYMSVQEDNGADGTDSPDGVLFIDDALIYPSRTGFKSSTTKASIQNIISTSGISDNISNDVANLLPIYMDKCVGLVNDRRLYWCLPNNSTTNNQIWTLDLRQKGAWMTPMYINCDWLWLYSDNSDGKTKMLGLVNNQFVEFDQATQTNDNGVAFQTNIGSGAIKFSDDGAIWGSVIDVTFVFLRPQGNINLSVDAYTEDGVVTYTDQMTSGAKQSVSGFGQYGWGQAGWGNLSPYAQPLAISASKARKTWTIPIDEEVNVLTWGVNTTEAGVSYQLAEVIVRYVSVGYKEVDN